MHYAEPSTLHLNKVLLEVLTVFEDVLQVSHPSQASFPASRRKPWPPSWCANIVLKPQEFFLRLGEEGYF